MSVWRALRAARRFLSRKELQPGGKSFVELVERGYAPEKFRRVNDPAFVRETDLECRRRQLEEENLDVPGYFAHLRVYFVLATAMLVFFALWRSCPYTALFRQLTLSEYTLRRRYLHTWLSYNLSFRRWGDFALYFPLFIAVSLNISRFLNTRFSAALFLLQCMLSSNAAVLLAKNTEAEKDLMVPKVGGQNTVLFFAALLTALRPESWLFRAVRSPLSAVVALLGVYEYYRLRTSENREQSPAVHLFSLANGLVCGFALRKLKIIKNV